MWPLATHTPACPRRHPCLPTQCPFISTAEQKLGTATTSWVQRKEEQRVRLEAPDVGASPRPFPPCGQNLSSWVSTALQTFPPILAQI